MQRVLEKMGFGCKAIDTDGRPPAFQELFGRVTGWSEWISFGFALKFPSSEHLRLDLIAIDHLPGGQDGFMAKAIPRMAGGYVCLVCFRYFSCFVVIWTLHGVVLLL